MGNSMIEQAIKLFREKRKYRYWLAAFLCLAVLVTLGTVTVLKMNGQAANHKQKLLNCQIELHEHTEGCYDSEGRVICGYADYAVHTHNDDCYDSEGTLVCQLPEVQAHTHSPECYQEKEELVCGQEESEGHVHTEECYTRERGALICGQEEFYIDETGAEQEAHVHTDDCYEWTETLSCGQEEGQGGHTHTESCYETKTELVCGEQELHTHDETCYGQDGQLTCGLLELKEHVHGEECFETIELTKEEIETLNSAENPEKTEEAEKTVKTFEDETVKVTAEYGEFANIPEEAELVVKQITEESDPEHFAERREEFQNQMGSEQASMDVLMDIGFYLDGEEIEPDDTVTVKIQFADGKEVSEAGPVNMVHFADDGTEVLEDSSVDGDGVITFEMDSFSEVALFAAGNLAIGKSRSADDTIKFHCLKTNETTRGKEVVDRGSYSKGEFAAEIMQMSSDNKSFFSIKPAVNEQSDADGKLKNVFHQDGYNGVETAAADDAWIGYSIDGGINITVNSRMTIPFGYYSMPLWRLCDVTNETDFSQSEITDIYYLPGNTQTYTNEPLEHIISGTVQPSAQEFSVIFNPWNSTGNYADGTGDGGGRWEYGYGSPTSYEETGRTKVSFGEELINEDTQKATIWLPSNDELNKDFHFDKCGETDCKSHGTVKGQRSDIGYKYELAGWYNIAERVDGQEEQAYYSVKNGAVSVEIDPKERNVFYADWIAAEDNFAHDKSIALENGEERAAYTDDFVTTKIFDYNELFNLYSAYLATIETDDNEKLEQWEDTGKIFQPLKSLGVLSFLFFDGNGKSLGFPINMQAWNDSHNYATQGTWGEGLKNLLDQYLFDETGNRLGVQYLGTGNYLYKKEGNHYVYDSQENGASYDPQEGRFYLQGNRDCIVSDKGNESQLVPGFFPLNKPFDGARTKNDGTINYHFGMSSEINFYLPGDVGTNNGNVNLDKSGEHMRFEFSGDDDVWVYVDDKLVLDMGGVHSKVEGWIDFSNGTTYIDHPAENTYGTAQSNNWIANLEKGPHKLKVYYLERGGNQSNCKIKFNIIPRYQLEPPKASTVTFRKVWAENSTPRDIEVTLYQFSAGDEDKCTQVGDSITLTGEEKTAWSYTWEGLDPNYKYKVDENDLPGYEKKITWNPGEGEYEYWINVDTSDTSDRDIDQKNILFVNSEGNKALGINKENQIGSFEVIRKNGVLLTDSVTNFIQWKAEKVEDQENRYKLKNIYRDLYLKIDGSSSAPQITADSNDASIFEANNINGGGFSTSQHRLVYQEGKFEVKANQLDNPDNTVRVDTYMKKLVSSEVRNYIITNTPLTDITIAKVDSKNTNDILLNASFSLSRSAADEQEPLSTITQYYDNGKWTVPKDGEEIPTFQLGTLQLPNLTGGSYTLTEKTPPTGYQHPAEPTINFVISGNQITEVNNEIAEIDNRGLTLKVKNTKEEPDTVEIKFVKIPIGSEDKFLGGAEFKLYLKDAQDNGELTSISGMKTSNIETGIFFEGELSCGEYLLRETKAPDGYNKLSQDVSITISKDEVTVNNPNLSSDDQNKVYSINDEGYYEIKIPNSTGYKLPHTGGSGTYPFAIGSAVLFSTAAFLLYGYSIRQKRRQKRLRK